MEGWESFGVAEVGAAAVLTGFVLVGVSVNLREILSEPSAPPRIVEALAALLALLVGASVLLIPHQRRWIVGMELLLVGAASWVTVVSVQRQVVRRWNANHAQTDHRITTLRFAHTALGQVATLPFVVAGVMLLLGSDNGLYGVAIAAVGCFGVAFLDAWVLLIGIHLVGISVSAD